MTAELKNILKALLTTLSVGELRIIEDYAQQLRIALQERNLQNFKGEA